MNRLPYYLSLLMMSLILLGMLGIFIVSVYPYDPLVVANSPAPVLNKNKSVESGTILLLEVKQVKTMDIPATVSEQFTDGLVYTLPSRVSHKPAGDIDEVYSVVVPVQLPPGQYIYKATIVFQINPFRTVTETWQSERFTVTAPCK